ncbi:hypothetical protein M408DRAFT_105778 [Serendipita vermifera MAFF 305830]|uniref:Uncharacterized protein n=1 Tax=Serendipita vermifera MAFF 305830 TaxID=933852 RepID=A0A0C3BC57_SERVB|nr:hypothetical protein M408DRAFT_105778 [Serendipita vermifera MAFF 305830]
MRQITSKLCVPRIGSKSASNAMEMAETLARGVLDATPVALALAVSAVLENSRQAPNGNTLQPRGLHVPIRAILNKRGGTACTVRNPVYMQIAPEIPVEIDHPVLAPRSWLV